MRIIGKTHDYYDSAMAYGIDPSVVFERTFEEFYRQEIPQEYKFLAPNMRSRTRHYIGNPRTNHRRQGFDTNKAGTEFSYYPFTVAFCGKIYPGLELHFKTPGSFDWKAFRAYTFEEWARLLEDAEQGFIEPKGKRYRSAWDRKGSPRDEQDCKEYFEHSGEDRVAWFAERAKPIVVWKDEDEPVLRFNSRLEDVAFYKVFDAYSAFQELDMFVSGVMTREVHVPNKHTGKLPNPVEIGDTDLRDKKGFDDRSFRKAPTKRR